MSTRLISRIKRPLLANTKAASKLNKDQKTKTSCRLRDKLISKWENEKVDTLHTLAIQLQVEDEELVE